MFKLGHKYNK